MKTRITPQYNHRFLTTNQEVLDDESITVTAQQSIAERDEQERLNDLNRFTSSGGINVTQGHSLAA